MKLRLPVLGLAALAIAGGIGASACEIPILVILATAEDGETGPPVIQTFCTQAFQAAFAVPGPSGAVTLNAERAPVSPMAQGDVHEWFLTSPRFAPLSSIDVEATGAFELTSVDARTCTWSNEEQALGVRFLANGVGDGSVEVKLNGAVTEVFDFEVAAVESLTLTWDPSANAGRAHLEDENGRTLSAFYGITWEVVPNRGINPQNIFGPTGPEMFFDGSSLEVELYVYFGSLSQHMTLVANPDTGLYAPKTDTPNPTSTTTSGTGGFGTGGFGTGGTGAGGSSGGAGAGGSGAGGD